MSRFHGRHPRDWTIDIDMQRSYTVVTAFDSFVLRPVPGTCLLSMRVTPAEAQRLMNALTDDRRDGTYVYRGSPSVSTLSYQGAVGLLYVSGIEVTEAEALRVIRNPGGDPLDVILGPPPACGYRLFAVPDQLGRA